MPVWSWKHLTAVATFSREDHESEYDDDPKEGSSDPAFFDSKRKELNQDSYDQNLKSRLHRSFKRCEQKDLSEDVEEGLSSENDEEMRQWRQKLSILNKEMSRPPRAPSQRDHSVFVIRQKLVQSFRLRTASSLDTRRNRAECLEIDNGRPL